MRERNLKTKGLSKGAPSGVLISIIFHAVLFLIAAGFVVFEVVKEDPPAFVPPEIKDRPKMKLRKPKVKLKKSAQPKQTTRIVTPKTKASMPDIQLPEMSGMTDGLLGGVGGFDIMPDLSQANIFGTGQSIGNDFVGTFYDFNRDRTGRGISMDAFDAFRHALKQFMVAGWNPSRLSRFYRSPRKLYTTTFAIGPVQSSLAPDAFGEGRTQGWSWAAHYKGLLVYPEDIKIRFWGQGDDILIVRVGGEVVLNACWPGSGKWGTYEYFSAIWDQLSPLSRRYGLGNNASVPGDWIELKAGEPVEMEVLIGEVPGGEFCAILCVEVEGEEYPTSERGVPQPVFPIFKTAVPSADLLDAIEKNISVNHASAMYGPVFQDFAVKEKKSEGNAKEEAEISEPSKDEVESKLRMWTSVDGNVLEAELLTTMSGKAVLRDARGKQLKYPVDQLSEEDRLYIELSQPPKFNIEISNTSRQVQTSNESPYIWQTANWARLFYHTFGAKLKQTSASIYNHKLKVEYYVFGKEVDGDYYVLLDRKSDSFTPANENKRSHRFYGKEVKIESSYINSVGSTRGIKYGGYLITVTDERGEIIQYKTTNEWLFDKIEQLKKLPVGAHFDKTCKRIGPPRPSLRDDERPIYR